MSMLSLNLSFPHIMGVLNCTPDSFYDGGQFFDVKLAIKQAHKMVEMGASIIDIGGESTRPGAAPVSIEQECERVLPVIEQLAKDFNHTPVILSIDTRHPEVMQKSLDKGATLINDVNALQAEGALAIAAAYQVPVCIMHMQGTPETMQKAPHYENVVSEVKQFLEQRRDACLAAGIAKKNIIIDPGFGFGKTLEQNLLLLKNLREFESLGCPLLVGLSRKSMFGQLLGVDSKDRLPASLAAATIAIMNGAHIIRTHDVKETYEAAQVAKAVMTTQELKL